MMSSAELVTAIARTFLGATKGSAKHKQIINTFNTVKPHGYRASLSDPWCAESWTAWQIMAGNNQTEVPMSASCSVIIQDAKKLSIWQEDESVKPGIGWGIIYDWQDSGKGNNTGSPDHIGIVYEVDSQYIYVIEGNMGSPARVGKRAIKINGRYIRGFVKPKYSALKASTYKPSKAYALSLPTSDVIYGSTGDDVARLQRFLNWCINANLKVDKSSGKATVNAILVYQKTYGLDTDGSFGPACRKKAKEIIASVKQEQTLPAKIAQKALDLAWPKGTASSKYSQKSGAPTAAYKTAEKRHYPKCTNLTECHVFVATTLSEAGLVGMPIDKWSNIFKWLRANCTEIKVNYTQDQLRAGDIRVHKNSNGGYHIWLITDGKGTRAEAAHNKTYPHINPSNSGNVTHHKADWLFRVK